MTFGYVIMRVETLLKDILGRSEMFTDRKCAEKNQGQKDYISYQYRLSRRLR